MNENTIKSKPKKELINELIFLRNPPTLKELQNMSLENLQKMDIELFITLNQSKEYAKNNLDLLAMIASLQMEKSEAGESRSVDNKR